MSDLQREERILRYTFAGVLCCMAGGLLFAVKFADIPALAVLGMACILAPPLASVIWMFAVLVEVVTDTQKPPRDDDPR